MKSTPDAIQHQLMLHQKRYIESLPDKLSELLLFANSIKFSSDSVANDLETLMRQVHSLAGSGPTFGLVEMGREARENEKKIVSFINRGDFDEEQFRNTVILSLSDFVSRYIDQSGLYDGEPVVEEAYIKEVKKPDGENEQQVNGEAALANFILLDEDPEIKNLLKNTMPTYGYNVVTCSDFAEFLKAVETQSPEAVLVSTNVADETFSSMDVVSRLDKHILDKLSVVFMSDKEDFYSRLESVRAGGDAFVTKPLFADTLANTLDGLLGKNNKDPYRILIVDDDAFLAEHFQLVLQQQGMQVVVVTDCTNVLDSIVSFKPELVLMDINMPGCSGIELAKMVRQQEAYINIPIVYLSSISDKEKQFEAIRTAGDDFLGKPIKDEHLVTAVEIRVGRARKLTQLVTQDGLTGLLDKSAIQNQLEIEIVRTKRHNSNFVFCMLDVDCFKHVNDTYGHIMGDKVLKKLAQSIRSRLRRSDSVGRFGGEEFAVILPDTELTDGYELIDNLRSMFSKEEFSHGDDRFRVTFSAGIVVSDGSDTTVEIVASADEALYFSKRNGRNKVTSAKS